MLHFENFVSYYFDNLKRKAFGLRPQLLYNRKTSRLRRVWVTVTDNGGVSGAAAGLELTELNWVHSTKTASCTL